MGRLRRAQLRGRHGGRDPGGEVAIEDPRPGDPVAVPRPHDRRGDHVFFARRRPRPHEPLVGGALAVVGASVELPMPRARIDLLSGRGGGAWLSCGDL